MKWQEVGETPCSMARSLAILGDRWTLLILRNCFLGMRRFDEFQASLGVTRQVLADRLSRLVEAGALKEGALPGATAALRIPPHRDGPRPASGAAGPGQLGRPLARRGPRRSGGVCAQGLWPQVPADHGCPGCGEPVGSRDVTAVPGPGSRRWLASSRRTESARALPGRAATRWFAQPALRKTNISPTTISPMPSRLSQPRRLPKTMKSMIAVTAGTR